MSVHSLCRTCAALCCRNLAIQIYRPVTKTEIEDLKWQLQFEKVKVFIRHRRWYQLIESDCMYLTKDNRCAIYEQRPSRCRRYTQAECEHHGPFYEILLSTPQALDAYLEEIRKKRKAKKPRRRKK
ncbi:MAG: YkgJ family cysteine cluster protein [Candidatus Omnitrophica bacterium]|nr:YkgJ family cysteine cluster protein [Candidatus Omnitrophota bacterium]